MYKAIHIHYIFFVNKIQLDSFMEMVNAYDREHGTYRIWKVLFCSSRNLDALSNCKYMNFTVDDCPGRKKFCIFPMLRILLI